MYCLRTLPMCCLSSRALLYLAMSDWPFHDELAASITYFSSPLIESFHLASHVTVLRWTTSAHLCSSPSPRSGTSGTLPSSPTLIVMSSGMMRALRSPIFGCSPLPRNSPGGSTRKLPTFSCRPSTNAYRQCASPASFSFLAFCLASLLISFFAAVSSAMCAAIASKLHFSKSMTALPAAVFLSSGLQDAMKFFVKMSFFA
mmetsp:Transcript_710/g.1641  ORF Transcript_710/g.1641 Transcript_710/m.1641 type:complete len:201 (+) Transcript_710:1562-2164(+)